MHRGEFGLSSQDAWNTLEPWEVQFDEQIARRESQQIEIRRHLHTHPEPSGEEIETSKFIVRLLSEAGLKPRLCRDGVGVVADLNVGKPSRQSPLIAIRGDLDALRISDEKTVAYASQKPGVMHACGHDVHTSILLGAALAGANVNGRMSESADEFGACLRFLFQPAEETCVGAQWLVEQGALGGVDAILGMHVDPERLVGEVGIRYGVLTANCDEVELVVKGHGGHAARPHQTIDPIAASAHLISTLYKFLPRSIDSRNPSVFTIGTVNGGCAPNVIPEHVELRGSLRTIDSSSRNTQKKRIEEICGGVEQNSGAKIHIRFLRPLKAVYNHPHIASALEEASQRVLGSDKTFLIDRPSMGGEDFSVYLDHVPGALLRLGCGSPGGNSPFLHSPRFDVDERTIAVGTRILIRAALLLSITKHN